MILAQDGDIVLREFEEKGIPKLVEYTNDKKVIPTIM